MPSHEIQIQEDVRLEKARPGDVIVGIDGKWMVCQYSDFPDMVRDFLGIEPLPVKSFDLDHYPNSEEAFVEAMTEIMPNFKDFFCPKGRIGNPGIMSAKKDEDGEPLYQFFGLPEYDPTKSHGTKKKGKTTE